MTSSIWTLGETATQSTSPPPITLPPPTKEEAITARLEVVRLFAEGTVGGVHSAALEKARDTVKRYRESGASVQDVADVDNSVTLLPLPLREKATANYMNLVEGFIEQQAEGFIEHLGSKATQARANVRQAAVAEAEGMFGSIQATSPTPSLAGTLQIRSGEIAGPPPTPALPPGQSNQYGGR